MKKISRFMIYLIVIVIVVWTMAPYLWLIISSISTKIEMAAKPLRWIPAKITLSRYAEILWGSESAAQSFRPAFLNSIVVALITTFIVIVVGVLAAYSISRFNFIGQKSIFFLLLATQMIPPVTLAVPLYSMFRKLGLLDTRLALIITYSALALPLIVWILKGFFDNLPVALEEAARIDGCSRWQILFKIIVPLSLPALTTSMVLAFITCWDEYFFALTLTQVKAVTMPVAIASFSSKYGVDYLMTATAGVLVSIFPVFLSLIFQKYVVSGLTQGAVKE